MGLSYRPDIDGLRGLSVLAVILFHVGFGFQGGFVGVDFFFVISGFLITTLIQYEIDQNQFFYVDFWERRMRRLIPALLVCVFITLIAGYVLLLPSEYRELGQSSVAQSLGLANFHFWRETGYFAGSSHSKPLLHLWSLAVEEQFYLFMPGFLILLNRAHKYLFLPCLFFFGGISFVTSVVQTGIHPHAAFFLLPSRAWEFLIGTLVAICVRRSVLNRPHAELVSGIGFFLIIFSCLTFSPITPFPGWKALLPCFGVGMIIFANNNNKTYINRILQIKPLVFTGKISYSLYIYHWPIMAFNNYWKEAGRTGFSKMNLILLSYFFAILSWKFVEQPIRKRELFSQPRDIFKFTGIGLTVCLLTGLFIHFSNGISSRFTHETISLAAGKSDTNKNRNLTHDVSISQLKQKGLPVLTPDQPSPPIFAIIGDSHADAIMPVLKNLCDQYQIPSIGISGSAIIPLRLLTKPKSQKDHYRNAIFTEFDKLSEIKGVLLAARWNQYLNLLTHDNFRHTIEYFQQRDCRIWLLRQVPEPAWNVPRNLALSLHWDSKFPTNTVSKNEYFISRSKCDQIFNIWKGNGVNFLDPAPIFFPDGRFLVTHKRLKPFYFDDDHLSVSGAEELRPIFENIFKDIKTTYNQN